MTVVDVTKMWSRDGADWTSDNADPTRYDISISEGYQVLVDNPQDDIKVLLATAGVPNIGDTYRGDTDIRIVNVRPTRVGPVFWMVEVLYRGGPPISPSRPDIQWGDATSTEPIDQDVNGLPIVNVNNEPVEGLTMELADNVCVIKRRFALFNPFLTSLYRHSVSSDEFLGYPAGTPRLTGFSAKNAFRDADDFVGYWDVTATIQFRRGYEVPDAQAWWKRYRNEGFYEKVRGAMGLAVEDSNGRPRLVHAQNNGQNVTRPVMLDANGFRVYNQEDAVWLTRPVYRPLPYSALGLL